MAQLNAIQSWLRLKPTPEIILIGDEPGIAEVANTLHCRHIPDVERNEYGTPLVSSLWEQAERHGSHNKLCYVNADIILLQDWLDAILSIDLPRFLAVGKRWDWNNPAQIDFKGNWQDDLMYKIKSRPDMLHVAAGVDYFAFSRGLYKDIPPFAVGRIAWDNWLTNYPLTHDAALIDITESATAIHQNHRYGYDGELGSREIWDGEEAAINKELSGFYWASIDQATYKLTPDGLRYQKIVPFTNLTFLPKAHKPESTDTVEVDGKKYPAYLNRGNANQFIAHIATRYCIGSGLDIGAGKWPVKIHHGVGTPVDFGLEIDDAVTLPGVERESQDFIFSSHCLEHLSEWETALDKWKEVLRPGGILFLFLPHPSFKPWNPGGAWVSGHMWKPECKSLCKHLEKMGFEILGSDIGPDAYQSFHIAARKPISKKAPIVCKRVIQHEVSFVIPARNESAKHIETLDKFIRELFKQASRLNIKGELIIVEWNPPEDRKRIRDAIKWNHPEKKRLPVKIVTVSRECHDIIFSDKPRNTHPYMAMNVGAARANNTTLFMVRDITKPVDIDRVLDITREPKSRALWCDDNYLIIDRELFAQKRGFIEIAEEANQVRWLKSLLAEQGVPLVASNGGAIPTPISIPRNLSERALEELRVTDNRRDKIRAKNGPNWGMKHDALPTTGYYYTREFKPQAPRRIAFVLTAGMGDMLLSIPTVKALAKKYPHALIDWVTHEGWAELVPTKYANPVAVPFSRGLGHLEPWLSEHAKEYDEIHIAMAFQRRIINAFYNTHMMDCVAAWSGVSLTDRSIDVDISGVDVSKIDLPERFVAICSSPCYSCNPWPEELRNKIVDWLHQQGFATVAIGGKDGQEIPDSLNLCGKLTPKETIAVINKAALYVGPDNGCSWLACAAKDTPKLCFIDPLRFQIPVGFEGYATGMIRDVKYDMPFEDIVAKIEELFTISEGVSFVLSYSRQHLVRQAIGKIAAWVEKKKRKAEVIIVDAPKVNGRHKNPDKENLPIKYVSVPNRYRECLYDNGPAWLRTGLNIGAVRAQYNNLVLITNPNKLSLDRVGRWAPEAALYDFGWIVRKEPFCKARGFIETATCEGFKDWQFMRHLESIGTPVGNFSPVLSMPVVIDGNSHEGREQDAIKALGAKNGLNWGLRYDNLDNKTPENLLIILTGGIGDVLEGIPTVKALRRKYPKTNISWLINSKCVPFVPPGITAIGVDFDRDETLLNKWLQENGNGYDQKLFLMAVHRHFSRAHYKMHMVNCIASWADVTLKKDEAGLTTELPSCNMARHNLPERYVAFYGGLYGGGSGWPKGVQQELAEWLRGEGHQVVLVGGGKWLAKIKGAHTSLLNASLLETAVAIRNADLYIGIDTGISWVSCLTDTPKMIYLGPGKIQILLGYSGIDKKAIDLTHDIPICDVKATARKLLGGKRKVKKASAKPTIDVALIVLNGEPWLEAWLKTYRDFADRIVVVEGVDTARFKDVPEHIRQKCFTKDGHSLDNTLDILNEADANITLITKNSGFWPDKNAMFAELSKHCFSDYVFEIDGDEFYFQADLESIRSLLSESPDVGTWWCTPMNFWKSGQWYTKASKGDGCWWCDGPVLFKWHPGMTLVHRPRHAEPPINNKTAYLPFKMYHYNYVMAKDAEYKRHYHKESKDWYQDVWCAWSEKNRIDLEKGIQPGRQEKTELVKYEGRHPKYAQEVLTRIEKGL